MLFVTVGDKKKKSGAVAAIVSASQRSLHNAPIFRLLLKVAVNGTHQCDFLNFCGGFGSQHMSSAVKQDVCLSAQSLFPDTVLKYIILFAFILREHTGRAE